MNFSRYSQTNQFMIEIGQELTMNQTKLVYSRTIVKKLFFFCSFFVCRSTKINKHYCIDITFSAIDKIDRSVPRNSACQNQQFQLIKYSFIQWRMQFVYANKLALLYFSMSLCLPLSLSFPFTLIPSNQMLSMQWKANHFIRLRLWYGMAWFGFVSFNFW